jgi:L-threonylcarbamoyladenylate synthase
VTAAVVDARVPAADVVARAAAALRAGEVVALPTDTVYGLAALPAPAAHTARLFALKGRAADVPVAVLCASPDQGLALADPAGLTAPVRRIAARLWPGPLTLVLPRRPGLGYALGEPAGTIGVRCPDHPLVRALAAEVGPLATTSANLHGEPTPPDAAGVATVFGDGVGLVLDGGPCGGEPSTVVDCTGPEWRVLRAGAVTGADLAAAAGSGDGTLDHLRGHSATVHRAMGTRGELLALVDSAPGGLKSLQAALTTWTDRALVAEVLRRQDAEAPRPAVVAPLPGGGDDYGDLDDLDPPVRLVPSSGDDEDDVDDLHGDAVATSYVVVALPDRWRVVGRGYLAVSDGHRSWAGTSTLVTERDSTRAAIHDAGAIGACLYPGRLLRNLSFTVPEPADIEGRPCWFVEAGPRDGVRAPSSPRELRLHRDLAGIDHRIWFDAATGIVLRHEGSIDGEPCSSTALTDLVFDGSIVGAEFRPPPGAVVRSRHELLRDHLASMGIDPDTVDLDDPVQVRDALRHGG